MKKSQECEVIKDLLPSYIDNLTSKETNIFIEEHLQNCEMCKDKYNNMNKDILIENDTKESKKFKIFKKVNNKIKLLKSIIFMIIAIFIILFIRKLIIINKIENMASKINYNNYYESMIETTEKYISKIEYYQNGENFINIDTKIRKNNDITKIIEYRLNGKEDYKIIENNVEKENIIKPSIATMEQYQFLHKSIIGNIGIAITPGSLRTLELHSKKCYLVKLENYLNFIDKETGLTIKEVNIKNNSVIDYKYTFGDVTDKKIEEIININI